MADKISIRFFGDRMVRAAWDEEHNKWWFSVLDIVGILNDEREYTKTRNYWKYLKTKYAKSKPELVSGTNQLKMIAADGKKYMTDVMDSEGVMRLAKNMPNNKAMNFLDWFTYSDNTIDGQSRKKAYQLFEGNLLDSIEVGTTRGLQQIHAYLFGGLYDFAGQIRTKNISKGGFTFGLAQMLPISLMQIEAMPHDTYEEIMDKYVEMNVAHPFMEGNGRSTRIWLDMMLKASLQLCVDWSLVDKHRYLAAMAESTTNSDTIKDLLYEALTDRIADRELFMKGIDYSYYYEQPE